MVPSERLEEVVHTEAADRFCFLIDDYDYGGPETTPDGLAYHGRLQVSVGAHSGREPEVSTLLAVSGGTSRARLSSVYVHLGLGPAQDVPEGASSTRVALKRLDAQATALRRVLAEFDAAAIEAAITSCQGR